MDFMQFASWANRWYLLLAGSTGRQRPGRQRGLQRQIPVDTDALAAGEEASH